MWLSQNIWTLSECHILDASTHRLKLARKIPIFCQFILKSQLKLIQKNQHSQCIQHNGVIYFLKESIIIFIPLKQHRNNLNTRICSFLSLFVSKEIILWHWNGYECFFVNVRWCLRHPEHSFFTPCNVPTFSSACPFFSPNFASSYF